MEIKESITQENKIELLLLGDIIILRPLSSIGDVVGRKYRNYLLVKRMGNWG